MIILITLFFKLLYFLLEKWIYLHVLHLEYYIQYLHFITFLLLINQLLIVILLSLQDLLLVVSIQELSTDFWRFFQFHYDLFFLWQFLLLFLGNNLLIICSIILQSYGHLLSFRSEQLHILITIFSLHSHCTGLHTSSSQFLLPQIFSLLTYHMFTLFSYFFSAIDLDRIWMIFSYFFLARVTTCFCLSRADVK